MRSALTPGSAASRQFALLAPRHADLPGKFYDVIVDQSHYDDLLAEMQRLRGRVYLEDGAITTRQLTPDGRHDLPTDESSWHLLLMDADGHVAGCMRYLSHRTSAAFSRLGVCHSALAQCEKWGQKLRQAVKEEMYAARMQGISFGEVGGWAVSEEHRHSTAALNLVLGLFSLSHLIGDALVLSTATLRNNSANILRRIGGRSLEVDGQELPTYFDPQYHCEMQILRFDSRNPNTRYRESVRQFGHSLVAAPVFRQLTFRERLIGLNPAAVSQPAAAAAAHAAA
jgi:predicted GNAT family N-acyltransferase